MRKTGGRCGWSKVTSAERIGNEVGEREGVRGHVTDKLEGHCKDAGFQFELYKQPSDDFKQKNDVISVCAPVYFLL